jgi:cell division initiation protein
MTSDDTHGARPDGAPPGRELDLGPTTGPLDPAGPPSGPIGPGTGPISGPTSGPITAPPAGHAGGAPFPVAPGPTPVAAIGPRLTPEGVRRAEFTRTGRGRRGYSEADVEQFRLRVVQEINNASAEKAELRREAQRLRAEVQRLRDYYRRQRVDVDRNVAHAARGARDDVEPVERGPSPDAVNAMSQAQQAADQHIAQAEDYARRLVQSARRQYDEILVSAQEAAERVTAEAHDLLAGASATRTGLPHAAELEQLEERVAYLRTFAHVTQLQLRSFLDGLRGEVDRFAVPPPDPAPSGPAPHAPGYGSSAPATGPLPAVGRPGTSGTAPETGPMPAISTPPRGFPARGALPVRTS